MKPNLLITVLLLFLFLNSCNKKSEKLNSESGIKYDNNIQILDDKLSTEQQKELNSTLYETKNLLDELLLFKDKEDFHIYGFGGAYKYNDWLKKAGNLKKSPYGRKIIVDYGFALGDLEMLGLEYVKTKGKETEYSNWAKKRIIEGTKLK